MIDRAMTVREVSEYLGIRQHGVLFLLRAGELRGFDVSLKRGKKPRWRIFPDDLDAFVLGRTHQTAPPRRRRRKPKVNVSKWF